MVGISQVAEEEYLIQELRKIETRKREREKKAQDLQKLITAADSTTEMRRADRKNTKKKPVQKREAEKPVTFLFMSHFLFWFIRSFHHHTLHRELE